MKNVLEIMTKDVVTALPTTSIREISNLMTQHSISAIPIVNEEKKLVGIVTSSDLVRQGQSLHIPTVISIFDWVIPLEGEKTFKKEIDRITAQQASDIMTKEVITVSLRDNLTTCTDIMSSKRLHALPVIYEDIVVGIITRSDIIRNI